jgi:hypothetical protein
MTFRVSGNKANIQSAYHSVKTLINKSNIHKNRKLSLQYLSKTFDKMYSLYNEKKELQAVAFSLPNSKLLKIFLILETKPGEHAIVRLIQEIMKTNHNRNMMTVNTSTNTMRNNLKKLGFEPTNTWRVMEKNLTVPVTPPKVHNKLEFKNEKVGNLDIRVIPRGQWVYKGFSGNYKNNVLGNEKHFYLAPNVKIAEIYTRRRRKGFVRPYQFTKEVRLLHMTPRTVNYLIRHVFRDENRNYLLFAFGQLPDQMKKTMYRKFNFNNCKKNAWYVSLYTTIIFVYFLS